MGCNVTSWPTIIVKCTYICFDVLRFVHFSLRNPSSALPVLHNSANIREFTVIIVHKTVVHVCCMVLFEENAACSTVDMEFYEF